MALTIAEIIAEADALEAQVQSAIDLRMPTLADESIARRDAFRAEHFPLLVAVAEAAVEMRAKMRATYADPRYMNVWATAQERLGPYTGPNWIAEAEALDAALRGEGKKP